MSGPTVSPGWSTDGVAARLSSLVRGVAFWTAAVLPFVYIPLVAADPARLVDFQLLGAFLSLNVLALVVGHGHYVADERETAG